MCMCVSAGRVKGYKCYLPLKPMGLLEEVAPFWLRCIKPV